MTSAPTKIAAKVFICFQRELVNVNSQAGVMSAAEHTTRREKTR